ncbi:uncharacterized protein LOC134532371 isoform X2 [Bacillus rossius redtenbacheri]|uniref:uncharacterized protein LOC134532371 isoform X2 n=1 Tax=Bacillus rossius redtenbacheri TaxID=93214 RepID=UPI002FDD9A1A
MKIFGCSLTAIHTGTVVPAAASAAAISAAASVAAISAAASAAAVSAVSEEVVSAGLGVSAEGSSARLSPWSTAALASTTPGGDTCACTE